MNLCILPSISSSKVHQSQKSSSCNVVVEGPLDYSQIHIYDGYEYNLEAKLPGEDREIELEEAERNREIERRGHESSGNSEDTKVVVSDGSFAESTLKRLEPNGNFEDSTDPFPIDGVEDPNGSFQESTLRSPEQSPSSDFEDSTDTLPESTSSNLESIGEMATLNFHLIK